MDTDRNQLDVEQIYSRLKTIVEGDQLTLNSELAQQVSERDNTVVVIAPNDEQQVSDVLQMAFEQGWSVLPAGGQTHLGTGNVLTSVDIVLSSRNLNRIVDYSPADMVVTVQSGMPLSALQKKLAEYGQMLPIDPVCDTKSTIGGVVALGASGPMQMHYGTVRDMAVGMSVIYPDGRRIKTGSKVVKNVAGYDMTKLFTGSYGTLVFIAEISLKLRPLPLHQSLVVTKGTAAEVEEYIRRIIHSQLVPSRVEVLAGEYPFLTDHSNAWYAAVDCHENRLAGQFQASTLRKMAVEMGLSSATYAGDSVDGLWAEYQRFLQPSTFILRYSVKPVDMIAVSERIRELLANRNVKPAFSVSVPRGVGRVYAAALTPETEQELVGEVRSIVGQSDGFAVIENGSVALRSQIDAVGFGRSDFRLMQAIKRSIDPNAVMSPGRLRGIETWDKANLKL